MKVEIPDLRRCCFCVPLRKGILAWGYVKLVYTLIVTILYCSLVMLSLMWGGFRFSWEVFLMMVLLFLLVLDVIFTNVLLIGAHTKGQKLLHVFYIYGVVNLAIECILLVLIASLAAAASADPGNDAQRKVLRVLSSGITYIICNAYILLLVKSEIKKLKDEECKIEFVNNAAEAACVISDGAKDNSS